MRPFWRWAREAIMGSTLALFTEVAMADYTTKRGPHKFLSLDTDWEADFWAKRFAVSRQVLEEAVAAVGYSVENVREYLNEDTVAHL
jgi:hypothetical protein